MPVTWQSNATKFGGKKFAAVVLFTTSFCKKFVVVRTNSRKTKVSSNFLNLDSILKSPIAKNYFLLFWKILKLVDTWNFIVSLHFFAYMLNFQVSLQKREMFVWKGKDKQISLARLFIATSKHLGYSKRLCQTWKLRWSNPKLGFGFRVRHIIQCTFDPIVIPIREGRILLVCYV